MNILRRRQAARPQPAAPASAWRPVSGPVTLTGDSADMDTEAQATGLGYRAHLVRFACPLAAGARILSWTYAAYADPTADCDDLYEVGFRYQLQVAMNDTAAACGTPYWTYDGHLSGSGAIRYTPLDRADQAARNVAENLASHSSDPVTAFMRAASLKNTYPDVFRWDGQPFEGDTLGGAW